jgi:translation initiation factor IF-2
MSRKKTLPQAAADNSKISKLEIVLKGDVTGTVEAVGSSLVNLDIPGIDIRIIQSGVGNITKSDVLMARTGSRLVIGFNVDTMPEINRHIQEHGVEIRLYNTIYTITEDVKKIASNLSAQEPEEITTGKAKIIAIFKAPRKDIVIGCEVVEGTIELGKNFRIITAMGPAYSGRITSLQIERKNVKAGKPGQQVGIRLSDWKKARVDDWVECFEIVQPKGGDPWRPRSRIVRSKS